MHVRHLFAYSKFFALLIASALTGASALGNVSDTTARPLSLHAQSNPDTEAIRKADLARYLVSKNFDSALLLARQVLDYAKPKNFYDAIGKAYNAIGWAYLSKGRYDSCTRYLLLARTAFKAEPSAIDVIRTNMDLSEAYARQSLYAMAIQSLLQSETDAKKTGDEPVLNDVNRQLGIIYRDLGDWQKSVTYLKNGIAGYERMHDDFRYINTSQSLAIEYNGMHLPDSALFILNKVLPIAQKRERNEYQVGMVLEQFGNAWMGKKDPQRALDYFLQAYHNFKKSGNTADIAYEGINIGSAYVKLKSYDKAELYYHESLGLMDSLSLTNYRFDLISEMSAMYAAREDWKKAFEFLKRSVSLRDSVTSAANYTQANEIKERYETTKKEQEIALLKKDNELNLLTLQKQRAWQYAAIMVIILLTLIGVLVVNRYRVVQKSKRLIEIEKMRNDIASDLHDDIGSTLSSLNIQSRVLSGLVDGQPSVKENLQRIHDHTLEMMDSMSDIVWAINPKHDTLDSVIHRMKEFAGEVLELQNIPYSFNQQGDFSGNLNPRQRKNLYLIFKEVINNLAKYAKCSAVIIDLNSGVNGISLTVTDDGVGFDPLNTGTGNGLRNIRARTKELNGELTVESVIGRGTSVRLTMRYHNFGTEDAKLNSTLLSK